MFRWITTEQETDPVLLTSSHLFHKELIANSSPNNSPGIPAIDTMMNCMQPEDIADEISILCKKTYTSWRSQGEK
jgi:hypothetical protein